MGLDMYLTAKRNFSSYDKNDENISKKIAQILGVPEELELNALSLKLGYWRKANHIHKWFVDKVQEGKDECQESYVETEQLEELLKIAKEVIAHPEKAADLLPTRSGFFFGPTGYDEYYFKTLKATVEILEKTIKFVSENGNYDVYYLSSW
jgi:Fe-S oxidoreductase